MTVTAAGAEGEAGEVFVRVDRTVEKPTGKKMKVVVLTSNYKVVGFIFVADGKRMTDMVCEAQKFIAVTDAQVWERLSEHKLFATRFMDISRDDIEIVLPADEIPFDSDDPGWLGTWLWEQLERERIKKLETME